MFRRKLLEIADENSDAPSRDAVALEGAHMLDRLETEDDARSSRRSLADRLRLVGSEES